jgi:hypothetical protein
MPHQPKIVHKTHQTSRPVPKVSKDIHRTADLSRIVSAHKAVSLAALPHFLDLDRAMACHPMEVHQVGTLRAKVSISPQARSMPDLLADLWDNRRTRISHQRVRKQYHHR